MQDYQRWKIRVHISPVHQVAGQCNNPRSGSSDLRGVFHVPLQEASRIGNRRRSKHVKSSTNTRMPPRYTIAEPDAPETDRVMGSNSLAIRAVPVVERGLVPQDVISDTEHFDRCWG